MPLPKLAWTFDGTTTDYVSGVIPVSSAGFSYTTGKYNQAASFTNTVGSTPTNYIVYDFTAISSSAFTVCCWVNTVASAGSGIAVSIAGGNREGDVRIFLGGTSPGNVLTQYRMLTTPPSTYTYVNATSAANSVVAGVWNHVAVTITESSVSGTVLSCFFNGSLASTTTSAYGAPRNLNGMGVGAFYSLLFNNGFNGSVDDLRIYNTALTAAQVLSIYNQRGMPGRVGLSRASSIVFMQNFGTSSVPTSDLYGATLTSFGSPTMYLDATRGYVFPGTGSTYMSSNFNLPVSYSKSIWVYLTGAPGVGNLISSVSSSVNGIHFMEFNSTYSIRAGHYLGTTISGSPPFIFDIGTDFCTYVTDPGTITLNQWTHYVLTYDQSTTTMKLFKDGVQVASTTNAEMSWSGGNAVGLCHYNGSKRLSNGRVDNTIIYNRALNESEIYTLYTSQLNNPTLGETAYNPIKGTSST